MGFPRFRFLRQHSITASLLREIGPDPETGDFKGGEISRSARNHNILYQLSSLYDSIPASSPFSDGYDHF